MQSQKSQASQALGQQVAQERLARNGGDPLLRQVSQSSTQGGQSSPTWRPQGEEFASLGISLYGGDKNVPQ